MNLETYQISHTIEKHNRVEACSLFESAFDTTSPKLQTTPVHNIELSDKKGKAENTRRGI
jgi:hypothetical protein